MPCMEHTGGGVWIKECWRCKRAYTVIADKWDEARNLMLSYFSTRNVGRGADSLQGHCRSCGSSRITPNRDDMLAKQNGLCGICQVPVAFDGTRSANIDHCHTTNVTRMIICRRCNVGMHYADNEEWLAKAIAYRDSFRCE
jgi:Recombination endonuclease VII